MANVVQGGFRFKRMRTGGHQYAPLIMPVVSGYGTGLFRGDAVKLVSTGGINAAAAGDAVLGFMDGAVQYVGTDGVLRKGGNFLPASTTYSGGLYSETCSLVRIIPVLGALFEVDADDGSTATTLAAFGAFVGENADLVAGAGGNTTTGVSSMQLDISTHGTANTLAFRIEEVSNRFDADPTVTNFKLIVSVNLAQSVPYTSTGT